MPLSANCALVGGVPIHAISLPAVLEYTVARVVSHAPFGLIATVNLDFLRIARRDAAFRAILQRGTLLNVADGWPVKWLAQRSGHQTHRTTGSDLVPAMLRDPVIGSSGIFLLGDTDSTLAAVRSRGARENWGTAIAGTRSPAADEIYDPQRSSELVREINASGAGVLFVALGAPRQEQWMDRWREHLRPAVGIGVGAALRFLANPESRAPGWTQSLGLEWAHRLGREPRRLGVRYAADAVEFGRLVLTGRPRE